MKTKIRKIDYYNYKLWRFFNEHILLATLIPITIIFGPILVFIAINEQKINDNAEISAGWFFILLLILLAIYLLLLWFSNISYEKRTKIEINIEYHKLLKKFKA